MERPNVLFIMTDQQRGDCLGIEDHPVLETPCMDYLAARGARFTRAYSTCPVCIPARRSMLSGQFPSSHGLRGWQTELEWHPAATLPQMLADAGYHTVHVGRNMHQHPPRKRYGYEHMVLHSDDYPQWLDLQGPGHHGGIFGGGPMHNDWIARPWHLEERLHMTNWITEQAFDFLDKRDPTVPFFMTLSYLAPHPPLNPPGFYFDRYLRQPVHEPFIGDWANRPENDGKGLALGGKRVVLEGERLRSARAGYYGLINHVDDQLNRLLNGITGVQRMTNNNTIVIFTSDHGEMLGDHYMWHKSRPYEPSARVPLLMDFPKRFGIKPGTVSGALACLEDIMPTILDACGLDIPDCVDGRSLLPVARGEETSVREALHLEFAPNWQALTDEREKYVWWTEDGREQLFRLTDDPQELHDLAPVAAERSTLERWRARMVEHLQHRPEGFVQNGALVAGRPFPVAI